MGDNGEQLGSMLFLDNCSRIRERGVLREFVNETHEEILREFFSDFFERRFSAELKITWFNLESGT